MLKFYCIDNVPISDLEVYLFPVCGCSECRSSEFISADFYNGRFVFDVCTAKGGVEGSSDDADVEKNLRA